ncbi:dopamine beta-hydroxylase [Trichonephila clavipes]|nr:dopamine beta-hydroxylase [Trichonephila clavipes]
MARVWGGIILGFRTDLHVQSVAMRGHIYRDFILEQHARLFRGTMGAEFLFMDDNALPHRANIVDEGLQSDDITRMDWPAYSMDLNPIEHVWDMLGRRIATRQPPPTCLPELRRALLDEWCNIPQDQIDNLILSMPNRCYPKVCDKDLYYLRGMEDLGSDPDVYTDEAGFVTLDDHDDCHLLSMKRRGFITRYAWSRKFDTCDNQDYYIEDGTTHLVYAVGRGPIRRLDGINLSKEMHGFQRVQLLKNIMPNPQFPENTKTLTIHNNKVAVPNVETTYWCTLHRLPANFESKNHIIQKVLVGMYPLSMIVDISGPGKALSQENWRPTMQWSSLTKGPPHSQHGYGASYCLCSRN